MFHLKKLIAVSVFFISLLAAPGCEDKTQHVVLEPLPAIKWHDQFVTPYFTKTEWQGKPIEWDNVVVSPIRQSFDAPVALETKLMRDDRELWKNVLGNIEAYDYHKQNAIANAVVSIPQAVECAPPSAAFNLNQRAMLSRALQQHRNVLWRLGRLEMATRSVKKSLQQFLPQFSGGRIKDAETGVVAPLMAMAKQIQEIQTLYPEPDGTWNPGEFHFRMARLAQIAPILLQTKNAFESWNQRMHQSSRWQYLSENGEIPYSALSEWLEEYEQLLVAYKYLNASMQAVEQSFLAPNNLVAYPCINQNLKRMRLLSSLFDEVLPMQWSLVKAETQSIQLLQRLSDDYYKQNTKESLENQVELFYESLESQSSKLSRTTDLLFVMWDETTYKVWNGLPDFVDPIHRRSATAVEDPESWLAMYKNVQNEITISSQNLKPEPEQPLNKRGKAFKEPIDEIMADLKSPSRIDEVEHGLLAISELESHMLSIRDELLRLCKDGGCRSFPEAELPHSPRSSVWVVTWRQTPAAERTIGHSLIVLKLCQLHLSRLVQRLAEIYAWFAETSNADLSWKPLKSWQRIWTLYAEPNGTYANFLRSVSSLDSQISAMTKSKKNRNESETLLQLLKLQYKLFELSIDYARFVDNKTHTPVSYDDIIGSWEDIQHSLETIQSLTIERDIKNDPELMNKKTKVRRDYDR